MRSALMLASHLDPAPLRRSSRRRVMPLTSIAGALAALVSVGIIAIGTRYLVAPLASARPFGLPNGPHGDAAAWLRLKGIRDIVSGLVILVPLALGQVQVLGWIVLVASI